MSEMGTFMEHNKVGTAGFVILVVFIIGALASVYGIMGDIPRIAITISITMLVLISYLGLFPFKTVLKISVAGLAINCIILFAGLYANDFYETTKQAKLKANTEVAAEAPAAH